jgi:hypothetical protein
MIGHVSKNDANNLISICEKCHDLVHNGNLRIDGFASTGGQGTIVKARTDKAKDDSSFEKKIVDLYIKKVTVEQIYKELKSQVTKYRIIKTIKTFRLSQQNGL